MESLPFPRRLGPAPSATAALATELVRPLADGLLKSPKPLMKKQAVKRHHHKHNLRHRYEFLETLGKGTYGKVKKARESSGRLVAIKSIRKDKIKDEQDLMHIRREIEIMSSLNHPHIIAIHEVFENSSRIVIVMEYASRGDLYDHISERQRLSEREARHFFRQIVSAVQYCHQNGVVHRDLKLENILLDANGNIKIADFGLSNLYHQGKFLQTFCGSPLYASPEIVNGKPYTGPAVPLRERPGQPGGPHASGQQSRCCESKRLEKAQAANGLHLKGLRFPWTPLWTSRTLNFSSLQAAPAVENGCICFSWGL